MSRLRNVQGVTRVSLSKSEKADTARERRRRRRPTVGPCGKGSPPSFEVVVFFEKAAVADALATATGDTGTAAGAPRPPRPTPADATGKGTDDSAAKPRPPPPRPPEADPVTRRNSILLVAVAVVAAVGAYWMLVLAPKREEAAKLDRQITTKQSALAPAEADVADLREGPQALQGQLLDGRAARQGRARPTTTCAR